MYYAGYTLGKGIEFMKIMMMLPHIYGRGGIENVLVQLLQSSFTDENEVTLVLPDTEDVSLNGKNPKNRPWMDSFRHKVNIIERCQYPKYMNKNNKLDRIKRLMFCIRCLRNTDADIVIDIYMKPIFLEAKIRCLFHKKYRLIGWFHTSLSTYRYGKSVFQKYGCYADNFLAISTGIEHQLIDFGVEKNHIQVVYNPVKRAEAIKLTQEDGVYHFTYIGRMDDEQKNISGLLKALAKISYDSYILDIYGDGEDLDKLQNLSKKLVVHVRWHGWCAEPWEEVKKNGINALILTSNYEGFGMVIAEAIARGVPVLSSNCIAGPADMIQDGVNGYLYPVGNDIALVEQIKVMMDKKTNWDQIRIQNSISHLYVDHYVERFNKALMR